jgi:membrane protein
METIVQMLERFYLRVDRLTRGRLSLIIYTAVAFDVDDGPLMSRSMAYYALFSIFPLVLVLLSFSSFWLAADHAQQLIFEFIEAFLPSARDMIEINVEQVLQDRGTIGLIALVGLFWSASGVFTAMYRAVNRAWGNPKSKLFWSEKLFGLAVVSVAGLVLVLTTLYSLARSVWLNWRTSILPEQVLSEASANQLQAWLSNLLPILISVVMFIILYKTIPRNKVRWRDVWFGGMLAGLIWELARRGYTWYLSTFAQYSVIYGSVGAIIGFLLWCYLSAMILLMGAELTAQHTGWVKAGKPVESRPLRKWLEEWSRWENH